MKKLLFSILCFLITITCVAQPIRFSNRRPIWMHEQPSYYNSAQGKKVNVYVSDAFQNESVVFDISNNEELETNIVIFDIPKLLGALNACSEALSEVSTLSRKAKNALVEGIDTIFPRVSIMWFHEGTLVSSFNNTLKPDIEISGGTAKLVISGIARCRLIFNEKLFDPEFSGDENITNDYTLIFSSPEEINELISCIMGAVSDEHRRGIAVNPRQVFTRVFDSNLKRNTYDGFMRRFNPIWDPNQRPFRPFNFESR